MHVLATYKHVGSHDDNGEYFKRVGPEVGLLAWEASMSLGDGVKTGDHFSVLHTALGIVDPKFTLLVGEQVLSGSWIIFMEANQFVLYHLTAIHDYPTLPKLQISGTGAPILSPPCPLIHDTSAGGCRYMLEETCCPALEPPPSQPPLPPFNKHSFSLPNPLTHKAEWVQAEGTNTGLIKLELLWIIVETVDKQFGEHDIKLAFEFNAGELEREEFGGGELVIDIGEGDLGEGGDGFKLKLDFGVVFVYN
ncbi:hypothetical protein BDQ12DRAFT_666555 [Crucibulum laeve]|uniref:Uncharacterized protein n=1 Tax=Crucibulum laeve TaxID=68775 RepID=A0A5C3M9Z6_9AGAR|nr:hypothetical protein BDQ12DRAFT_666555 [Crucibulum laeve]